MSILSRLLALSVLIACASAELHAQQNPDTADLRQRVAAGEECFLRNSDSAVVLWKYVDSVVTAFTGQRPARQDSALRLIQANAINNIGLVYLEKGMVSAALEHYFRAMSIREALNDTRGIAESCNNIAFLYLDERDTTKAMEYFERGQQGYSRIRDTAGVAYTMVNRARVFVQRGQYDEAMPLYRTAIVYFEGNEKELRGYTNCLNAIGIIHGHNGLPDSALYYCRRALAIRQGLNDKRGMAGTYGSIARIYLREKRLDSAFYYAQLGYNYAVLAKTPDAIVSNARMLSEVYKAKGDFRNALDYYEISIRTRDSITNKQLMNELVRQDLNYNFGKKFAADSIKNEIEQEMLDAELQRSQQQRYYLAGGLLLVVVFAGVVFNRFRVTRRQNVVIEEQKKVVEHKQKEVLDSIQYATRIQRALLAGKRTLDQFLGDYFILYQPKDIVSGDFYWAAKSGTSFWFCAADCTGHGVPGAFMSLLNISYLNEAVNDRKLGSPSEVLGFIREKVSMALMNEADAEGGKDGMDCVLCRFDLASRTVTLACANNPVWIIRSGSGQKEIVEVRPDKMPVGRHVNDHLPFTQQEVQLQKGDVLYLFTDGYADQFGGLKGKKFLYKRFRDLLSEIAWLPVKEQERILREKFVGWRGNNDQVDDVLVIGIKF